MLGIFKNRETKGKEATTKKEALAEQELQTILSSPVELKNLCSILNTRDSLKIFNLCTHLKSGKEAPKTELPKASELVGTARWGSFSHTVETRQKEAEIAQRYREVKALGAKAAKGDTFARMTYPTRYRCMQAEMGTYERCQNISSVFVFRLLQTAVLSGRIKNLDKLQDLIAKTQVENKKRKEKLGLIEPQQTKAPQRSGESR